MKFVRDITKRSPKYPLCIDNDLLLQFNSLSRKLFKRLVVPRESALNQPFSKWIAFWLSKKVETLFYVEMVSIFDGSIIRTEEILKINALQGFEHGLVSLENSSGYMLLNDSSRSSSEILLASMTSSENLILRQFVFKNLPNVEEDAIELITCNTNEAYKALVDRRRGWVYLIDPEETKVKWVEEVKQTDVKVGFIDAVLVVWIDEKPCALSGYQIA
jgi:hypothetical protein